MLSYRHAFHAGNFADVVKHVALIALLRAITRKPAPCFCIDTHAGAGVYDLAAPPPGTRREFAGGIARLWRHEGACPPSVARYLELVRAANPPAALAAPAPSVYPGSPALVRACLRAQDRLVCCELHPTDFAALRASFAGDDRIELRRADGYATLAAVLPPRERRGLVLIDPAYERADEPDRVCAAFESGMRRFGHGVFAVWYPITRLLPLTQLFTGVARAGTRKVEVLRAELCVRPDDHPLGLNGSGLLIANPPYRSDESIAEALEWLQPHLAPDGAGRTRTDWL
jgi:23S rRNA (adenine2030-N6)-methyltransferase